jgi:hypothetical protein
MLGEGRNVDGNQEGVMRGDVDLEPVFRYVISEDFTAVTVKNAVLWDTTPCGSCKN